MKATINVVLLFCILLLGYMCYASIRTPVRFDELRKQREEAVKLRLADIREAQDAYRLLHDRQYAEDFDTLVRFVRAEHLPLLQRPGFCPDSLCYIPFGRGARFEMEVRCDTDDTGRVRCQFEVRAPADAYLGGLDRQSLTEWKMQQEEQGNYAGLKIGNLETGGNAGNWE